MLPAFLPRRARLVVALVAAAAALPLTVAAPAHAGSYVAWICKTSSNVATSTEGWYAASDYPNDIVLSNTCSRGADGALSAGFTRPAGTGNYYVGNGRSHWEFTAPAGTSIAHAKLQYGYGVTTIHSDADTPGSGAGVGIYRLGIADDADHVLFQYRSDKQGSHPNESYVIDYTINGPRFGFDTGCFGPGNGQCGSTDLGRASIVMGWQQVFLTDDSTPRTAGVTGSAIDPGVRSGLETVSFQASDEGSGVYATQITLDGVAVAPWQIVDGNNGRCAPIDVDVTVEREFAWAKPCPSALTANLSFDTRKVADGDHLLGVQVSDAAGNVSTAIAKKITIANGAAAAVPDRPGTAGVPNGTGGSAASGRIVVPAASKSATAFGKPLSLGGKVVDAAGTPLAGAFVDVYETVDRPGAPRTFAGTLTADGAGAFSYAVKTRSSRTVEFAYAPTQASTAYVSQVSTLALVRASVSLAVTKSARAGRSVRFSGVLGVDPLPAKGARVVIETKTPKGWITAAVVRTRKAGAFGWSHRFSRRGTYRFRARVLSASDLPAKVGHSATRTLKVR